MMLPINSIILWHDSRECSMSNSIDRSVYSVISNRSLQPQHCM